MTTSNAIYSPLFRASLDDAARADMCWVLPTSGVGNRRGSGGTLQRYRRVLLPCTRRCSGHPRRRCANCKERASAPARWTALQWRVFGARQPRALEIRSSSASRARCRDDPSSAGHAAASAEGEGQGVPAPSVACQAVPHPTARSDYSLAGYVGSSNLTFAGLQQQGELNVDVVNCDATRKLQRWFDDRWDDDLAFDLSDELVQLIETSWAREEPGPSRTMFT